jgi:enoyl-CoA hydratase/carnithine racemase
MGTLHLTRDGHIATLTLDNPGKLNAIDAAMWQALKQHMETLSADDTLRCVILRGAGDTFAAGGDIEEFLTLRDTFEQALTYHGEWVAEALDAIGNCRHPTIAAIQGPCIGGGLEIAGQCDLRIAGRSARFGVPIGKLGFTMWHGELRGILALAGPAVALELLLEGRLYSAEEAHLKGLVQRVVNDDEVLTEATTSARRIAAGAPLVARAHKRLVRRLMPSIAPLTAEELRDNLAYLESEDYREGLRAFFEKRGARFGGR